MSKEFGKRIRQFREENAMTQDKLATKMGVTVSTLNRWENGANFPRSGNIANLANTLNISAKDFLDTSITDKTEISEINKANTLQLQLKAEQKAFEASIANHTKAVQTGDNYESAFSSLRNTSDALYNTKEQLSRSLWEENYKTMSDILNNLPKYLTDIGLKRLHDYLYYCLLREEESTTDEYKELLKQSEESTEE